MGASKPIVMNAYKFRYDFRRSATILADKVQGNEKSKTKTVAFERLIWQTT
jgi:hypothetical protein